MVRTADSRSQVERLLLHLLRGEADHEMAEELRAWLGGSTRFRAFVDANRDKIRKKLRGATDDESRRDVRAELRVANLLLADRHLELAFEAYGTGKVGPDFSVTWRGERTFNLEVTRLHRAPDELRIAGAILAKLRQLPPSTPNALLIAIEGVSAETLEVGAATRMLRARADAGDEAFFTNRGFGSTRGFYERYLRLGAVLVWCEGAAVPNARSASWSNRSARIVVPERALRACMACLRAG